MKRWPASAALCIFLVFIDQFSKAMASVRLPGRGYFPLIGDILGFEYVENTGAAFGIFQNKQWLFIISSLLIFAAAVYVIVRLPYSGRFKAVHLLLVFLVSGAIGNLADRLRLGYVVDFIYFKLINFPVFNIADSYIVVSVIVFIALILFYYSDEELEHMINSFGTAGGAIARGADGSGEGDGDAER
jgi:signal peptidase II